MTGASWCHVTESNHFPVFLTNGDELCLVTIEDDCVNDGNEEINY